MNTLYQKLRTFPVTGFVLRYWLMVIFLAAWVWLTLDGWLFQCLGAILYLPALVFGALSLTFLGRHFSFGKTADRDAGDGTFALEWKAVSPTVRVVLNVVILCVFFLGTCIIAAALAK